MRGKERRTLKNVAFWLLQYLERNSHMHILVYTRIIVHEGPFVLGFDEKIIIYPIMAHVMDAAR